MVSPLSFNFISEPPDTVEVNGGFLHIKTDFRYWLKFEKIIKKETVYLNEFDYLLEEGEATQEVADALFDFFDFNPKYPISDKQGENVVDFEGDAPFIYASFKRTYGIDLFNDELHWWKFKILLFGLLNPYSEIIKYRAYTGNDKDMLELKEMWKVREIKPKIDNQETIDILLNGGDFTKGG